MGNESQSGYIKPSQRGVIFEMDFKSFHFLLVFITLFLIFSSSLAANKYSKEANQPNSKEEWKNLDKPFRLAKINLIWTKAQKRLTDFKLKSLFSELKLQDKEELQLKRLKADNLDKNGLKEAELRKKFGNILERYGLMEHFGDETVDSSNLIDKHANKNIFKDKKLNKLWLKAESAGFTETELKVLKEEFIHHQEKVMQFYSIMEEHNSQKLKDNNAYLNEVHLQDLQELEDKEAEKIVGSVENVRDTHRDLKKGYDRLERMALSGPKSKEFDEPQVQTLWAIALKGDFNADELDSLRTELRHYEQRLQKLRYLHAQQAFKNEGTSSENSTDKEKLKDLELRVKHQERKVVKLHSDLEARITQRHLEL